MTELLTDSLSTATARLHRLVLGARQAIYDQLLARETHRLALQHRVQTAAAVAFDALGGIGSGPEGATMLWLPDLDLTAIVSLDEEGHPIVMVRLGPVAKTAQIEPNAYVIAEAILGCAAELVADRRWQLDASAALRPQALQAAEARLARQHAIPSRPQIEAKAARHNGKGPGATEPHAIDSACKDDVYVRTCA